MSKISVLGVDLGKNVLHVHGVDRAGREVMRRRVKRSGFTRLLGELEPCVVAMEACGGAHYWGRLCRELGHEPRLIPPAYVKGYVTRNKNDWRDAEAICEAAQRPKLNQHWVSVKTVEQQELQMVHRVRSAMVKQRTRLANQVRGFLLEYGVVVGRGIAVLRRRLPELLEDGENGLTPVGRELFARLYEELCRLDEEVAHYDARLAARCREDEGCQRLVAVTGIGVQTATAAVAHAGDARSFANGRHFAASLGLVPRQHGTGGKPGLQGISKRGNRSLRTLYIHAARAALRTAARRDDRLSRWVLEVERRRGRNVATVALANKLARISWALLRRRDTYRAQAA